MNKIERPLLNDHCDKCKFKGSDGSCNLHRVHCGAVIECHSFKNKYMKDDSNEKNL